MKSVRNIYASTCKGDFSPYLSRLTGLKAFEELKTLLYEGAVVLFEKKETGSGVDLTKLFLDTLDKADAERGEDNFQKIAK